MSGNNSSQGLPPVFRPEISPEAMYAVDVVSKGVLCPIFSVFGIVTNLINMLVFAKSGFQDSINITFFAIAVSDFGACIAIIIASIGLNPWIAELDLPVIPREVQFALVSIPHLVFIEITILLTAFLTLERCVCVVLPLKVKSIITRKKVQLTVVLIYAVVITTCIPFVFTYEFNWKFDPEYNETRLRLTFTEKKKTIDKWAVPLNKFLCTIIPFFLIVIFTFVLVISLKRKTAWRQSAMMKTATDQAASKEKKIANMVIFLASWTIVCFAPSVLLTLLITFAFDGRPTKEERNGSLLYGLFTMTLAMETINAAINIFIYYTNSSNYREIFKGLCANKKRAKSK